MKLEEYSKNIGVSKETLETLGLESESNMGSYSESLRDLMLKVTRDFESLLHPEMGFSVMIESSYLDEKDIKMIFEVFKAYNKVLRAFEAAKMENNLVAWTKEFFKEWDKNKSRVIMINKKLSEKWGAHDTKSLMLEYLG